MIKSTSKIYDEAASEFTNSLAEYMFMYAWERHLGIIRAKKQLYILQQTSAIKQT